MFSFLVSEPGPPPLMCRWLLLVLLGEVFLRFLTGLTFFRGRDCAKKHVSKFPLVYSYCNARNRCAIAPPQWVFQPLASYLSNVVVATHIMLSRSSASGVSQRNSHILPKNLINRYIFFREFSYIVNKVFAFF